MGVHGPAQEDRQRRIRAGDQGGTSTPSRMEVRSGGQGWIPVVLRTVDEAKGEMFFEELTYADSPPVVGNYQTVGKLTQCYPLPTAEYGDYTLFEWPETVNEQANPITTLTVPMLATRHRGNWIVMIPFKVSASLLPANEPPNECSFG